MTERTSPRLIPFVVCAFALCLVAATTLYADCSDLPQNILAGENCGVDTDTTNWQLLGASGTITFEGGDGDPAGSLQLDSVVFPGPGSTDYVTAGMCSSSVQPSTTYEYQMSIKHLTGTVTSCTVNLITFDTTNCVGTPTVAGVVLTSFDMSWQAFTGQGTTAASAQSGYLFTQCFGSEPFTVLLDNAVLEGAIFGDGFESGDVGAWSAASP